MGRERLGAGGGIALAGATMGRALLGAAGGVILAGAKRADATRRRGR